MKPKETIEEENRDMRNRADATKLRATNAEIEIERGVTLLSRWVRDYPTHRHTNIVIEACCWMELAYIALEKARKALPNITIDRSQDGLYPPASEQ